MSMSQEAELGYSIAATESTPYQKLKSNVREHCFFYSSLTAIQQRKKSLLKTKVNEKKPIHTSAG